MAKHGPNAFCPRCESPDCDIVGNSRAGNIYSCLQCKNKYTSNDIRNARKLREAASKE